MSLIETNETNQFNFEAFAAHEFYTNVNRLLVQQALGPLAARPQDTPLTIVDMACGTGAIMRLIAEEMERQHRLSQIRIIGVDPSAEALRRARAAMQPNVKADFVQAEADGLSHIVQNADVAFFCNAIHLVPNKHDAFQHVAEILAPDGIFACNSAFYQGTYVEGTERFYRLWTRRAIGWLKKEHPEVRVSRDSKAMARQWLTPEEYVNTLEQSGFHKVNAVQVQARMSLDAWRDLGRYWLFIEGALPGIPLALGAAALGTAVYETGQELQLTEVPRMWLQIVASK